VARAPSSELVYIFGPSVDSSLYKFMGGGLVASKGQCYAIFGPLPVILLFSFWRESRQERKKRIEIQWMGNLFKGTVVRLPSAKLLYIFGLCR
jgi:hypothetical protein